MSTPTLGLNVDLKDQVALVTGASRGLGRAIALGLANAGARVVCAARREDKLRETAELIAAAGGAAETMACDVTQGESVQKLVDTVAEKFGGLHILVNNAGITRDTLIPRMADDQWDDVINTN